MQDQPIAPMTVENIDEFDVWILNSHDLVISIMSVSAPWNPTIENYDIRPSSEH